jgi:FkbM family methyltransferase
MYCGDRTLGGYFRFLRPPAVRMLDQVSLLAIRILRAYAVRTPFAKGLARVDALVNNAAQSLRGNYQLRIRARDRRVFCVDPRELQYHMGVLGMGIYEPLETSVAAMCLAEGGIAFDIGANFGWYTTLFSRILGDRGKVHAFEPILDTFKVLETNCVMNRCANVNLNNCALGNVQARSSIYYFPGQPSGNASLFKPPNAAATELKCDLTTLDAYMAGQSSQRCDFIKCDAEGAEMAIIQGASNVLQTNKPAILLELNARALALAGYSPADLLCEIRKYGGYRFVRLGPKTGYRTIEDPKTYSKPNGYANVICFQERSNIAEKLDALITAGMTPHS